MCFRNVNFHAIEISSLKYKWKFGRTRKAGELGPQASASHLHGAYKTLTLVFMCARNTEKMCSLSFRKYFEKKKEKSLVHFDY